MVRPNLRKCFILISIYLLDNNNNNLLVGGIISNKSKKNKVNASKIEMDNVIFSPLDDDKLNTRTVRNDMLMHGIIKLTV